MTSVHQSLPFTDSIRLLRIQPGREGEPLRYSLFVAGSYMTAPEYYALSYCWGDPKNTVDSFCDGISLPITRSLSHALSSLRTKAFLQPVWVDAICIDQSNISERNQQVSIMGNIYKRASRVFIWTGDGDEHSAATIKILRLISQTCCQSLYGQETSLGYWLSRLRQEQDRMNLNTRTDFESLVAITEEEWRLVFRFYDLDWFFRVWVIQEVRGHQQVQLVNGSQEIEWDVVALVAKWILCANDQHYRKMHLKRIAWADTFKNSVNCFAGFNNASFMWNGHLVTRRDAPFLALLNLVRNFKATDPRDKIFALLHYPLVRLKVHEQEVASLEKGPVTSSGSEELGLQADYNLAPTEVYLAIALRSIWRYNSLEMLSYVWQAGSRDEQYPSWIPKWACSSGQMSWTSLLPFLYNAAGGTSPACQYTSSGCRLTVQGLNVGQIGQTSRIIRIGDDPSDTSISLGPMDTEQSLVTLSTFLTQDRWQDNETQELTAKRASTNAEEHLKDFASYILPCLRAQEDDTFIDVLSTWCSACNNYMAGDVHGVTTTPVRMYNCLDCDYGEFDLCESCWNRGVRCEGVNHHLRLQTTTGIWCPYNQDIVELLEHCDDGGNGARFQRVFRTGIRDRTFFRGSFGWVGVGTKDIEPGDTLAILFGSRVPFVLRKSGTGYRLVSDCYIHGLMDGEAIQMRNDGDCRIKNEDFVIS